MLPLDPNSARLTLDSINNGTARYSCRLHVQITWPPRVSHDGGLYCKTGKEAVRRSDGLPAAEYEADQGRRLWLGLDGRVESD